MGDKCDSVSLSIDKNMVRPILEKQIQAAIISQVGDMGELIQSVVSLAMSQKVNSKGQISTSSYDNKYDYLEILAANSIKEAAREALMGWLDSNKQKVMDCVKSELDRPERKQSIAKAYMDAIESSLSSQWRMNCDITFKEQE